MSEEKPKARILAAEDEEPLRNLIQLSLEGYGYDVVVAGDGQEALDKFQEEGPWDLIMLDIMMPKKDGFSVLEEIRKTSETPVVFLTALGSGDNVVKGFKLGADDYITKPFTFREVAARIEAILRRIEWMRQPATPTAVLRNGAIEVDTELRLVTVHGEPRHVTPIEYGLLLHFFKNLDRAISKEDLFDNVWGYKFESSTNLVEVGVRRLREKIEDDPSHPQYIRTIRGIGYRFCSQKPTDDES